MREHNEDTFLLLVANGGRRDADVVGRDHVIQPGVLVLGVFDGMGGAAAGEVASSLAADTVFDQLMGDEPPGDHTELALRMSTAIDEAGAVILDDASRNHHHRGMGTTATLAGVADDVLVLAQVGDSRAYLLRRTDLVQLTRDQTLVAQLVEARMMTAEDARTASFQNVVLQALGTSPVVDTGMSSVRLCRGDVLLVCSDGLSGELEDAEICAVLLASQDPEDACVRLVHMANAAGGSDNVTCVVVRFDGEGLSLPDEGDAPPRANHLALRPARRPPLSHRFSSYPPPNDLSLGVPSEQGAPAEESLLPVPASPQRNS